MTPIQINHIRTVLDNWERIQFGNFSVMKTADDTDSSTVTIKIHNSELKDWLAKQAKNRVVFLSNNVAIVSQPIFVWITLEWV